MLFLIHFFAIFDHWWLFMTLRLTFLKRSRQELHFEVYQVYISRCPKFDPICPQISQCFFSNHKKIIWTKSSLESKLRKKNNHVMIFLNKTNVSWGVIFQFRRRISKIVAGQEHKKLGRQPNFQTFLAREGLRNPIRRL